MSLTVHATEKRLTAGRLPTTPQTTRPIALQMGRADLPTLCRSLGFTKGAEIGVWKGAYSAAFCQANPQLHMLCVDPWLSYPAWLDTKNPDLPAEDAARWIDEAYQIARTRLAPLNCTIARMFSAEAAKYVPDRSLDVVYIDGNHVEAAVYEDLTLWAPKVRTGGIVAGHDYRAFTNKPTIHVIEAVQAYTTAHAIDPWYITAGDRTPSFLWAVR
jgi:hypothetical protein